MCTIPCVGLGMKPSIAAHPTARSRFEPACGSMQCACGDDSRGCSSSRSPASRARGAATSRVRRSAAPGGGSSGDAAATARRASAAARCSRRTTRGTRTSRRCRCAPTRRRWSRSISATGGQHEAAPRLRRRRRVRHPVHGRARDADRRCRSTTPRTATRAIPDRSRSRRTRRSKAARRATATGTCSSCSRRRAISTSSSARSGAGTTGTPTSGVELEPDVERAAPARLDVGRRGRAADPPRPRALRRGRERRDRPRGAVHGADDADAGTSSRRRTTRRRRPNATLPPMGLRLRLKASFSLVALPRAVARDPAGAEDSTG